MRRQPSLRSQLNQIRLWVRQGRTDAWIAHKLDVSIEQLERFKRDHDLVGDGAAPGRPADPLSVPPIDFFEADEVEEEPEDEDEDEDEDEAAALEEPDAEADEPPARDRSRDRSRSRSRDRGRDRERGRDRDRASAPAREAEEDEGAGSDAEAYDKDAPPRRSRRRGRRGGRGRRRPNALEATFDHGEDGYGLWLDPAIVDNPVYAQHWAGHRAVEVTFDQDAITIRRARTDERNGGANGEAEDAEGAGAED